MMALLTNKWVGYAVAALAIALAIWWGVSAIYSNGYDAAATRYKAEIAELKAAAVTARDAEIERQAAVNNAAKAREAARIADMQAQAEQLAKQIEELQREASQDPDAGRTALGAPSVQRINKVR
ncbi:putative endopeptidase protein [Rhizobium phage RHph_TM3_3_14B]|nr:putative endopeptidase protein [Rhizobium phage RHph_TM3_3_14B]